MECPVAAGGGECTVDGVEGDGVDRVHMAYVSIGGWVLAVAFE